MIETTTVPRREQIPEEYTWDLGQIYADTEAWDIDLERVESMLPDVAKLQGTIHDADSLLRVLQARDTVLETLLRLYVYASHLKDSDGSNSEAQSLDARAGSLYARGLSALSFISPEILALDPDSVRSWIEQDADLAPYRYHLQQLLHEREHVRSAEVEAVMAEFSDVTRGPYDAYEAFTNTDLVFPTIVGPDGKEVQLSSTRYSTAMTNPDRRFRREAFTTFFDTLGGYRTTLASTLAATVRNHVIRARLRNYPGALEAAVGPNDIPVQVYTNLVSTVRDNVSRLHRYVRLRKQILGVDEFHAYDLRAPLFPEVDRTFDYTSAGRIMRDAFQPLGREYGEAVEMILDSRWVDVYENAGKTSGAYSGGMYSTPPYILLNYQDQLTDVYTLAHEMGHSVHSFLTRASQPFVSGDYGMFLAEVASTLNEALLTAHLLRTLDDEALRRTLVVQQLEAIRGTLFRQASFAEIELAMHRHVESGQAVTADWLSARYAEIVAHYYGPDMVVDPELHAEWAYIPHFYLNFYVYQYATGISAALALAGKILTEGRPAVDRYLGFLRSGSSRPPIDVLRDAGVDMTTPEPIQQAIARFDGLLDELEVMAGT